jgi:hypothetical protein|tara:strand:- start:866 stop:1117 length:252 start_codon:yes stop_codon:yes gene_type:complete
MNAEKLGYMGQGIFNILRRHIVDQELRWNITERVMDLIVLILDEKKTRRFLDVYHSNNNPVKRNDTLDDPPESEIRAKAERLV